MNLPEAENDFFLRLYRYAVDFYQPKIEIRTGVLLGKINVFDFHRLDEDKIAELSRRTYPWLAGFLRRFVFKRRSRKLLQRLRSTNANRAQSCNACYFNRAIYVSFAKDVTSHEDEFTLTAVHELSHALWETLEERPLHEPRRDQEKFRLLAEGYATYAGEIWFLDLYPACVKKMLNQAQPDLDSIHHRGMRRIQELVEQYGSSILLEIPRRWNSF